MIARPSSCFYRLGIGAFCVVGPVLVATRITTATAPAIGPGDFESGNLLPPFSSVFTRSNDMTAANSWNIVSQDTLNPNWADFYDHTLGTAQGHFFVANGTPGVQDYMLTMTVPVARNTAYSLTGWAASLTSDPLGGLGVRIFDGAAPLKGGEFSMSSPVGTWQPFSLNFNSFNATFLGIFFYRTQASQVNAFALDDIQLVPEPASAAMLLMGTASFGLMRRRRR